MAVKGGLGKGLGALLGEDAVREDQQQGQGSLSLPISQVQPGLTQPRKRFEEEALQDLSDSIRTHGIIQPLTVRRLSSGYYQIIAGERRWRAAKLAGLKEVPVVVIEADDRKAAELAMIENLQREDLNPIEEANGYKTLIDQYGLTQEEVSLRLGKSRPAITNSLRLLDLPDPVLQLLEDGRISAGHGRALLTLPEAGQRRNVAQRIIEEGLSVRQTEEAVKRILRYTDEQAYGRPKETGGGTDPYQIYREAAAKELSGRLSRKVTIVHGARKGRVELEYYGDDDLTALLDLLDELPAKKTVQAPAPKTAKAKSPKAGGKA